MFSISICSGQPFFVRFCQVVLVLVMPFQFCLGNLPFSALRVYEAGATDLTQGSTGAHVSQAYPSKILHHPVTMIGSKYACPQESELQDVGEIVLKEELLSHCGC